MERRRRRCQDQPPAGHNGTPYSGINILMLWAVSIEHGFRSSSWMTFKKALDLNAHVRKDFRRPVQLCRKRAIYVITANSRPDFGL